MANFNEIDVLSEELAKKVHNLDTDSIKLVLSNTLPVSSTTFLETNITEIATGGGYTQFTDGGATGFLPSPYDLTVGRAGAVTTVSGAQQVLTATGTVPTFQYICWVNDTPTSPLNPCFGWLNHGSAISMVNTDTYTIPSGALFTIN
jgi:hypothetical protein